jgi:uncharacterized protein (TIGR03066 family)
MKRMMFAFLALGMAALAGCSGSSTSGTSGTPAPGGGPGPTGGSSDKLVGVWEMTKEVPELKMTVHVQMEFKSDGTAKMTAMANGKEMPGGDSGTYKHEGDKITLTSKDKKSGKDETETMTVKELTDSKLTVSDPKKGEDMTFTKKKK